MVKDGTESPVPSVQKATSTASDRIFSQDRNGALQCYPSRSDTTGVIADFNVMI